jgi:hypothetical protein
MWTICLVDWEANRPLSGFALVKSGEHQIKPGIVNSSSKHLLRANLLSRGSKNAPRSRAWVKTGDQGMPTSIYLGALEGEGHQSSQWSSPVWGLLFRLSSGSHVCSYPECQRCHRQAAYKFAAATPEYVASRRTAALRNENQIPNSSSLLCLWSLPLNVWEDHRDLAQSKGLNNGPVANKRLQVRAEEGANWSSLLGCNLERNPYSKQATLTSREVLPLQGHSSLEDGLFPPGRGTCSTSDETLSRSNQGRLHFELAEFAEGKVAARVYLSVWAPTAEIAIFLQPFERFHGEIWSEEPLARRGADVQHPSKGFEIVSSDWLHPLCLCQKRQGWTSLAKTLAQLDDRAIQMRFKPQNHRLVGNQLLLVRSSKE